METRFAPIIRVSTEKQKVKGESLTTQETQIRQYVSLLHGIIPDHCWKYKGQEHSTPGFERVMFDQLLADSGKGLFDAVIVTDASRWSRDNLKSKEGLNILRQNNIRFFVGIMEFDLHNPEHEFMLGMSTEINQLQASKGSQNSILNRIERAKRGLNSAGRLPYGRTFDKKTGKWDIDPIKKEIIENAAERYLAGEGIPQIAKTFNMNPSNLYLILTKLSGSTKTFRFKYKRIDEKVTINIPSLLDDSTIKKIHERIYINTTNRGNVKNKYLLSGYAYCFKCGFKLEAWTNVNGVHYYKHSHRSKIRCFNKFLSAPEIENSVLIELIKTFGDPELIEKAIQRATPDLSKVDKLTEEKEKLTDELKKIISQKDKVVDMVAEGKLTGKEVESKMTKLRDQEVSVSNRLTLIGNELSNIPDKTKIKALTKLGTAVLTDALKDNPKLIFKRPFDWKRRLIERAFSGKSLTGENLGIYITYTDGIFLYEIKGLLESIINTLPISDDTIIRAFHLDSDYHDIDAEVKKIRETLISNLQSRHNLKYFR